MNAKNFPGKVNSRRVGALARLNANAPRKSTVVDGEVNAEAHDKYLAQREAEKATLNKRISPMANTIRTKKKRAAR